MRTLFAFVVVVAAHACTCSGAPSTACNSDGDCVRSQVCRLGECVLDDGSEGEGAVSEGEGEGVVGEGEGVIGEGEGVVGEGEGGEGEGEGVVGEGEGEGALGCDDASNFVHDANNCSECFNACAADGPNCSAAELCVAGGCVCDATLLVVGCAQGQTSCNAQCTDVKTDINNCGECGNACIDDGSCVGGLQCIDGGCVCASSQSACPQGQIECDNACTDPNADDANCSECGNACGGQCVAAGCL